MFRPSFHIDPCHFFSDHWTMQLGANLSGRFGLNWSLSGGLAIDDTGIGAVYGKAGGGAGAGADISMSVVAHVSNGSCINDLNGPFFNFNSGGGWGPHVLVMRLLATAQMVKELWEAASQSA
jgi:hypothetical protein